MTSLNIATTPEVSRAQAGPVYVAAVTWRQYVVWRKLIWSALSINVANPILFLFAFGFGMGQFIDVMEGVNYLDFVVPGMVAYSAMFAASFEATIGAFTRYFMIKNWDAVLATPVALRELLLGEVLWATLKAMFSGVCVLVVGFLWGGIPSLGGALLALVVVFVGSVTFACCGLVATATARGYDFFAYFFTFWVTPMFVFSGVFFSIERFPEFMQWIAWLLPMTHMVTLVRALFVGAPLSGGMVALHLGFLVAMAAVAFWFAAYKVRQRMFD